MSSLFPGMNPYLEHPAFWSSFHTRLMVAIADTLAPTLRPHYYIDIATRTYKEPDIGWDEDDEQLISIPDTAGLTAALAKQSVERPSPETDGTPTPKCPQSVILPMSITVKERYLKVKEIGSDAVLTVIEVLSPKNKQKGSRRNAYERKRQQILGSLTNLIEIDLLRGNSPMTIMGRVPPTHYRIVVSRSEQRPQADLYGFNLPEPIPTFPLPLRPEEEEPIVNLQAIIEGVYDRARYNDRIDYHQPVPPPKLAESDQQWLDGLLVAIRGA